MLLNPYESMWLVGDWSVMVVQLEVDLDRVRAMLPIELRPAEQSITARGTHPVRLYFSPDLRASMTWPPGMAYRYCEQTLGIPFVERVNQAAPSIAHDVHYYMPRLWLNNPMPTAGGVMFWGYQKRLAEIDVTHGAVRTRYDVRAPGSARSMITAEWSRTAGETADRVASSPYFDSQRRMWDQRLISQLPLGIGPFLALSDFEMDWPNATVQSVTACIEINEEYVPGLPLGRFDCAGLGDDPHGAYVLTTPWRLSMPYSADAADWFGDPATGGG